MTLAIEESIEFHNYFQKEKNANLGRPMHKGLIRKSLLARMLWPESDPEVAYPLMTKLVKGEKVTVRPEWIIIIADACGVDSNFVLGKPSKFDNKYKTLKNEKESDRVVSKKDQRKYRK